MLLTTARRGALGVLLVCIAGASLAGAAGDPFTWRYGPVGTRSSIGSARISPAPGGGADVIVDGNESLRFAVDGAGVVQDGTNVLPRRSFGTATARIGADLIVVSTRETADRASAQTSVARVQPDGTVVWALAVDPLIGPLVAVDAQGELVISGSRTLRDFGAPVSITFGPGGFARSWQVLRVRASDGALLWDRTLFGDRNTISALIEAVVPLADGVVLCGLIETRTVNDNPVVRLALDDGTIAWQRIFPVTDQINAPLCDAVPTGMGLYVVPGDTGDRQLLRLSQLDGTTVWTAAVPGGDFESARLAVDATGVTVVRTATTSMLFRFDHGGTPKWQRPVTGFVSALDNAPDGTLSLGGAVSGGAAFVERVQSSDGAVVWRDPSGGDAALGGFGGAHLGPDGDVYVGSAFPFRLTRLRGSDGMRLWSTPQPPVPESVAVSPIVTTNRVAAVTRTGDTTVDLVVLDPATGAQQAAVPQTGGSAQHTEPCGPNAAVITLKRGVFANPRPWVGKLLRLDTSTNTVTWTRDFPEGVQFSDGPIPAVECTANGDVVIARIPPIDGPTSVQIERLAAANGNPVWSHEYMGVVPRLVASGNDVLVHGFNGPTQLLDGANGMPLWTNATQGQYSLALSNGDFAFLQPNAVMRLARADGAVVWQSFVSTEIPGSRFDTFIEAAPGRLVFAGRDDFSTPVRGLELVAHDVADGAEAWRRRVPNGLFERTNAPSLAVEPSGALLVARDVEPSVAPWFGRSALLRVDAATGALLGDHATGSADYSTFTDAVSFTPFAVQAPRLFARETRTAFGRAEARAIGAVPIPAWTSGDARVAIESGPLTALPHGAVRATYTVVVSYDGPAPGEPLRLRVASDAGTLGTWSCDGAPAACTPTGNPAGVDVAVVIAPGGTVRLTGTLTLASREDLATLVASLTMPLPLGDTAPGDNIAGGTVGDPLFRNGFE